MRQTVRKNEIADLEAQLRIMSQAAADAIERASKLEMELQSYGHSRSSSLGSLDSDQGSPRDRLGILENAMNAIYRSRTELAKPYNYQYI